ncbi:hypothetical protein JTE90_024786 [Oedothorax gibbosus]|uniref:Transposase n=1 Tax=Oedothorax gibbosus TaxID=931172 RepID=A0AAV6UBZ8_9ARAC|nr:hypothetical protein JTE90_024786 [Oedothorax gibbosus]
MASINELDDDCNKSLTLSVSDINDSLETVSPVPPTDTAESSSSSQERLLLLNGTFFKYLPEECTAHWITNDLSRVSVALACQRFRGVHSFDRLSDIIQEINGEFDLNTNKIVALVTDNGSNFVKAFKMFGVKLTNINIENEVMPDSQPTEASSESDVEEV